ncbi:MAG: GDP-mannose 4,6-dehydratase [Candidatus Omnitrophica bacterium]|nr:GDP-mannose 4,6-dehydratase [Candidatus Omnitrophota bacterium]MBU1808056.1 GDP-mannose 4,6-dehydratase [Candidatus Omnitrophota bacterium]
MKILITGGAGFIGSHLVEELLKKGEEVVVIDNLSTGNMENIEHLKSNPKFSFHIDTIMNEELMKRLIKNCDVVYHMAAAVGVKYIIDNPLESMQTNVKGTEIVLELANSLGKKKVIIASTSEIYGKDRPGKKIFKEEDDRVLGPTTISRWSYSCAKAMDEFLSLAYWREKKLPVVIVRFFNTVGPRQSGMYGMVVPRFVKHALLGQPITIYGDGKQTRSFTYVSDAVRAITGLANNQKAVGEIFNIGNPGAISIQDLAEKIKKLTKSDSPIMHIPYEKAYEKGFEDMRHRAPDITKIKELIGFQPKVDLDEMLMNIIKYFEK